MQRFYFDHNATTPVSSFVLAGLRAVLESEFGNPSSIHQEGQRARRLLDEARSRVAQLLGAHPREIVFTSGGTEAANLALFGVMRRAAPGAHLIISAIEHPAVLNAAAQLEREGYRVTRLPVDSRGLVDPDDVRRALRPETRLISIMHANNETGVIQPVPQIAEIARQAGVRFHSDGVQSLGRIGVNVRDLGVDLFSLSAHKIYALKGAGALYVRPGVELAPLLAGGRHEHGLRAGTENVAGIVALGLAAEETSQRTAMDAARLEALRRRLERAVVSQIPDVRLLGEQAPRVPNTANFCFSGIEAEALVIALDLAGFAVSTGAACSSGAVEPSHVLLAMGLTREEAKSSIRISLGRSNDEQQVDALAEALVSAVTRLRKLSPSYCAHA